MADYTTELVENLSDEVEEQMSRDLIAYESAHGIDVNYKKLAIVLRNETEEVIGVLKAYTAYSEIYVDDLWVDSAWRNQGLGTRLMRELEAGFENQGLPMKSLPGMP